MSKDQSKKDVMKLLEDGIKNVFDSGQFQKYLSVMSRFHNYSFRNSLLILLQKPDASHVASFKTWKTKFNRNVNKGEKAIRILAPSTFKKEVEMTKIDDITKKPKIDNQGKEVKELVEMRIPYFQPTYVFDVSQTAGDPLPTLVNKLTSSVDNYELFMKTLKAISPFPIFIEEVSGKANGFCDFKNKKIVVNTGMSEAHTIKTSIHEVVHSILHCDNRKQLTSTTVEVEAESIAFVVSNHFGIDSSDFSFGYVAAWSESRELSDLKSSLSTIQNTANSLISSIESTMKDLEIPPKAKHQEVCM